MFADKAVLAALAFPFFPARTVQPFDTAGAPLGSAVRVLERGGRRIEHAAGDAVGRAMDRRLGAGLLVRVKFQERRGRDELVVDPVELSASAGRLLLTSRGTSTARSLETTVGYRAPDAGHELYVSYVRAATHGDLNSLDAIGGALEEPFVQANQQAALPMDVPNRLLAWGLLHLPSRTTIAPFIEIRDGFPYTAINEDWIYVGARDAFRFPWFGSADIYVNKISASRGSCPEARIGLKI